MAKKPEKGISEKKTFSLDSFKENEGLNNNVRNKELKWIPLSEAFHEALKVPGIPMGYFTAFRGYSNTGKSTAIYEGIAGAQKLGILPVIFETEGNFNWEHAKNCGVEFTEYVDEETGEIKQTGDYIFLNSANLLEKYKNYDYNSSKEGTKKLRHEPVVEDIARFMNYCLDKQDDGELPRDIAFFWDSVGSLNCFKGAISNATNNQWTAGAIANCFKSLIYHRIPTSKNEDSKYTNTFAVVQQIWLDNENKVIKHKGGETFFSACRLIFHFGGILTHSTSKLKATAGGEEYQFGTETKVRCEKNHVNGIEQKGVIASTPHGYWNPDKIEDYKKEHRDYILKQLNTNLSDFTIIKEESTLTKNDLNS